ncbi:hypothetical protein EV421DRAFT_1991890 [Armillaria borealis]|uniref:F-box domain-containing protein n=1 Tax=Armillaria borealis TaxID=47425 RepID=A0AA39J1K2_9AGAR|nr:hypothetical protein EV421DRAFT_1991890 [Armillaria borealis]
MAAGPHILCNDIIVLLRTGQSSEDLDSETLASVKEHIHCLESEIVARDVHLHLQATSVQHDRDLAVQDLENHKSIFAPVRRLPNDVLLYIFQTSFDASIELDVKTIPWLLGYICHHWRALSRSSPSLWADVSFESVCSSNLPSGRQSLRKHLLSLSRNVPLKIRIKMLHPCLSDETHHPICSGDDRDIIWEDIALHSQRWSHIDLEKHGPSAFQDFSYQSPLLRSISYVLSGVTQTQNCPLFSSAPLLRDLSFLGWINHWRELARVTPLSHLTKLVVTILDGVDTNSEFYTCVKEARALGELHFHVKRQVPYDARLFPAVVHHNIQKLLLNDDIPAILDRCPMPNLTELFLYEGYSTFFDDPEVSTADQTLLLRFVERSGCNMRDFHCFRPIPLLMFQSIWKQWPTSLMNLTITVSSTTRVDAVRELTFEEGKPGVLPNLRHLTLRMSEGLSIFGDDSLLKMASSRYPGGFTTLTITPEMRRGAVLSQDTITQMKRLREMGAVSVRVKFILTTEIDFDYFETDERFAKFVEERKA